MIHMGMPAQEMKFVRLKNLAPEKKAALRESRYDGLASNRRSKPIISVLTPQRLNSLPSIAVPSPKQDRSYKSNFPTQRKEMSPTREWIEKMTSTKTKKDNVFLPLISSTRKKH